MTVQELMRVLVYFPQEGQHDPVRLANGDNLEDVRVLDVGGKLTVELRGATTVRNSTRSSQQDTIAASNCKPRQVIRTIRDRNEIQKITKSSAHRHGYQIR